jgi:hypothetical protein
MTKEETDKYNKEYYKNNREKIIENSKEYYTGNKEKVKLYKKSWRIKNSMEIKHHQKVIREKYLESWEGFIPKETKCQICGRAIFFNKRVRKNAIHFDHRHDNHLVKTTPITWLRSHIRNAKNEEFWIKEDFGILCMFCNHSLPTKNREEFVKNVVKYVFNKEV